MICRPVNLKLLFVQLIAPAQGVANEYAYMPEMSGVLMVRGRARRYRNTAMSLRFDSIHIENRRRHDHYEDGCEGVTGTTAKKRDEIVSVSYGDVLTASEVSQCSNHSRVSKAGEEGDILFGDTPDGAWVVRESGSREKGAGWLSMEIDNARRKAFEGCRRVRVWH